jgi:MYXO-CTERM domain-containing protein
MRPRRILAVALPILCAAWPIGREYPPLPPAPRAHATDIWMGGADTVGIDPAFAREAERQRLFAPVTQQAAPAVSAGLGSGFSVVGSVAVLAGDEATAMGMGARRGIDYRNLMEISRRFLAAFGDDYDQIAVYLAFTDYASAQSLAYQMRVKNDVRGIMIKPDGNSATGWSDDLFDASKDFGSPSGRMQTMLNMKRILAYGRGAANDPSNDLYAVWAQEAAHRWAAYLRFQRAGDTGLSDALLGRQLAHWAKGVQADGSIMDGYSWTDNQDGTFTATDYDKRYGKLDQYAMGLLVAKDVPPFFLLQDIKRATDDVLLDKLPVLTNTNYKGTKVDLTIQDVIRAMGPRVPATDPAAADLHMGVVLLTLPGTSTDAVAGESYRIDRTRHLWDDFYNNAGGGRGKVCTELLHPCRGLSLTYGAPALSRKDGGVPAPGDDFVLKLPISNTGTDKGAPQVRVDSLGALAFTHDTVAAPMLAMGDNASLTLTGRVPLGTPCVQALKVDFTTVEKPGRASPSKGSADLVVGALPGPSNDFEGDTSAWTVNPDGTDTATTGRWEAGTPERSDAFDFVVQPGSAWSGSRAFVTGASKGMDPSANDVSGGLTTLQSPPLKLDGLTKPHLAYHVYFVATDFQNEVLVPGAGDNLRVLASADDGKTWTEVDRVTGMGLGWQQRLIALADVLPPEAIGASALRFRFVAEDANTNSVVEAVIDDVGLLGEAASCSLPAPDAGAEHPGGTPRDQGCNCRVGGQSRPGWLWLLALGLAFVRRRPR